MESYIWNRSYYKKDKLVITNWGEQNNNG